MNVARKGTLYILGNGFDRCHKLDTSPKKFQEILRTKDIYNEMETADIVFQRYNVRWGDYESCLAEIDLESIVDEHTIASDYYSDHEYDRDGGIYNMEQYTESLYCAVQESLETMVDNANSMLEQKNPVLVEFLESEDAVLSFNYTSTLERLYDIPDDVPVCHIHGFREKGERLWLGFREGISAEEYYNKYFDESTITEVQERIEEIQNDNTLSAREKEIELLYWYACRDELTSDSDYYINSQREVVFQFYQLLKKEIQIEKLDKFLKNCKGITRVVVMGHSMSDVDSDYMDVIEAVLCPQVWEISQYDNNPSIDDLQEYSFSSKVELYNLYSRFGI